MGVGVCVGAWVCGCVGVWVWVCGCVGVHHRCAFSLLPIQFLGTFLSIAPLFLSAAAPLWRASLEALELASCLHLYRTYQTHTHTGE